MTATGSREWAPATVVAEMIGRDVAAVRRLVRRGLIRVHRTEGTRPLYSTADAAKLAPPNAEEPTHAQL